jgi:cellulose synthase/poly-beta-1,6-N-acetylglucosamine synthase-like glycosyltransferase
MVFGNLKGETARPRGIDVISVVVPALNEEEYITPCLESLISQSYDDYELIVVDGGSSDRTVELAEKYADEVTVFKGPVGAARNIGVKRSKGEILAFIDADTVACHSWLKVISESFEERKAVGVTGPTLPMGGNAVDNVCYKASTVYLQRFLMWLGIPHVAGFNCAYRRKPFLKVGGFDEVNVLSEDVRLSWEIKRLGRISFNEKMVAFTSTRRIQKYGYPYMIGLYLFNGFLTLLTGRSLSSYPPVRSSKRRVVENSRRASRKRLGGGGRI